jgi:metal-sulfur cluster biosynthetic enzyme
VLKADVESKLSRLPTVKEVRVEVVFDPPWHSGLRSDAAKLQLGFDLDNGANTSHRADLQGRKVMAHIWPRRVSISAQC